MIQVKLIVKFWVQLMLFMAIFFVMPAVVNAQNPEQTRKHMRHWRFMARHKNHSKLHYNPKAKDFDGDGVEDNNDHCPDSPKGKKVNKLGCPLDSDNDGIADEEDVCIDKAGAKRKLGLSVA